MDGLNRLEGLQYESKTEINLQNLNPGNCVCLTTENGNNIELMVANHREGGFDAICLVYDEFPQAVNQPIRFENGLIRVGKTVSFSILGTGLEKRCTIDRITAIGVGPEINERQSPGNSVKTVLDARTKEGKQAIEDLINGDL